MNGDGGTVREWLGGGWRKQPVVAAFAAVALLHAAGTVFDKTGSSPTGSYLEPAPEGVPASSAPAVPVLASIPAPGVLVQFDAAFPGDVVLGGSGAVLRWTSRSGSHWLEPLAGPTSVWSVVTLESLGTGGLRGIRFDTAELPAAPLAFSSGDLSACAGSVLAVVSGTASPQATLLHSPFPLRLDRAAADEEPGYDVDASYPGGILTYPGADPFAALPVGLHIVEVLLPGAVPLGTFAVGGDPRPAGWSRQWRGQVCELVFLSPEASSDVRSGARHYLARRWGVPGVDPATAGQIEAALSAGLKDGANVFTTVFKVR